ncbi:MAG TPA: phosphate acyltransferase [Chroococcales cyanobacterium]|jgi:phosphate butyryltransferase
MKNSFQEILESARNSGRTVVVAAAQDPAALEAVVRARREGIADGILVGNRPEIEALLRHFEEDPNTWDIRHEEDPISAAQKAIDAVKNQEAQILLKGKIPTSKLMKVVLKAENELRTGKVLSDVAVFEYQDRLMFLSDGGVCAVPTKEQKVQITENALEVAWALGFDKPKVALMSATEQVTPGVPSTVEAREIALMDHWKKIDCLIDGPFALDNALSAEDAKMKGIDSPVAGSADILIVPNIEAGNLLGKGLVYFAGKKLIHVIKGAKIPILICSRVDPPDAKLFSIALGVMVAKEKVKV